MERYGEKRAVIIGGTSGTGLATAKMFLDGGGRRTAAAADESVTQPSPRV